MTGYLKNLYDDNFLDFDKTIDLETYIGQRKKRKVFEYLRKE